MGRVDPRHGVRGVDLVVDTGSELVRVQCKYTSSGEVGLRRIHSNSTGYVVKRVAENAYDWLYVLRADGAEFVIRACHAGRRSIKPTDEHRFGPEVIGIVGEGAVAEFGRSRSP